MTPGRKSNIEPTTAYECRRHITLVQVLGMNVSASEHRYALQELCVQWGLSTLGTFDELVQRLAQHVIEYHRDKLNA
jgi:hypothetical protein